MARVTIIPAHNREENVVTRTKLKVAAYARVSTDTEEQLNSYTAQCNYYRDLIANNPDYEFVGLYTDEGITGTCMKKRDGFNRMIEDALNGKIEKILIKSISRLGRNTVDNLTAIRSLRAKGVDIYFENQNISTMNMSSELIVTIFSSLAQEESRSISDNVSWGKQRQFERGEFSLPYSQFLGYKKGANGKPEIVEKEAEIVRRIYRLFLNGYTPSNIATLLTSEKIPTPGGKEKWSTSTITSILQNEKYCGCALLQKCYVPDFLTHKSVPNDGQLKQYFIEDSHPAIIRKEVFELVQGEFEKRRNQQRMVRNNVFSGKIYCADCGGLYGAKVWHSTDKYRKVIFQCNRKFKNKTKCTSGNLSEESIKIIFLKAVTNILANDDYIEVKELILEQFAEDPILEDRLLTLQAQAANLSQQVEMLINNSAKTGNVQVFQKQYELLKSDHDSVVAKIETTENTISEKRRKYVTISEFFNTLEGLNQTTLSFSEELWVSLVEKAMVGKDTITFIFKDGSEETLPIKF